MLGREIIGSYGLDFTKFLSYAVRSPLEVCSHSAGSGPPPRAAAPRASFRLLSCWMVPRAFGPLKVKVLFSELLQTRHLPG